MKLKKWIVCVNNNTRSKIISLLIGSDMNVGSIVKAIGISQPRISVELRILRDNNVVQANRNGKQIIYSITDDYYDISKKVIDLNKQL